MDSHARALETRLQKRLNELFYQPGQVAKTADIGGDPEREFEDTFAGLALIYIRDKAPRLMDYLVGFQLIERDDDTNRAVGAFVFRPGNLWLLVYVFFLGGKMKGHEMIHVHSQDQFVPLKERWVNTLISARSPILGKGTDQRTRGGFNGGSGWQAPRLTDLVLPPQFGKMSSKYPGVKEAFEPFVEGFRKLTTQNPYDRPAGPKLESLLEKSATALDEFKSWTDFYPRIAKYAEDRFGHNWFERFTQQQSLTLMADKNAANRISLLDPILDLPTRPKTAAEKVRIITELETEAEELTPKDREHLLRDGFLVRDDRDDSETSKAWKDEVRVNAQNPTDTGVFQVLTGARGLEKLVVLIHSMTAGHRSNKALVFDPSDKGRWEQTPTNKIYARLSPLQKDEWLEWWEGIDKGSISSDGDSRYCIVSRYGDSVGPFTVVGGSKEQGWTIEFESGWSSRPEKEGDPIHAYNQRRHDEEFSSERGRRCALVSTDRLGARLCAVGDVIYYPEDGCKIVKLSKNPERPIELTSVAGVNALLGTKAASLRLAVTDHECVIDNGRPTSLTQGLLNLMRNHGLREDEARVMMKEAARDRRLGRPTTRYLTTKQAFGPPAVPDSAAMPAPPAMEMQSGDPFGMGITAVPDQVQNVQALQPDRRRRRPYDPRARVPDSNLMHSVQQAVESGQHDLVDTSAISGLLSSSGVESHVSEYASGLMKDVDRLCRLLILFYWHGDYFQQQYGKAALPEMEDRIRNSIDQVGDTILDLREKLRDIPGQESIIS